jgi:UDP-N-acetylglucosamine diphosphorylase / glucose-1-phosphate thymidylyltransferase / UDP-N-acetylgalactosamine diphosphorylase / glucosamine-1-phosphate N-acetyltransferase / galactosamine-1-phosphate N-acetyltransferase
MILIVCMAGLNTRFHNVGFDIPKYLLPWKNTTIIAEIVKNLNVKNVYLVAHNRDDYFRKDLLDSLSFLNFKNENLIYIGDTEGQAETAAESLKFINSNNEPVFFHNSDTILINRNIDKIASDISKKYSAYIDIFYGDSPKYSYVEVSDNLLVKDIKEKKIISKYASSGLYGFRSKDIYLNYYNKLEKNRGELFISNVLEKMLNKNEKIITNSINPNDKTIVLGSPEEYGIEITRNLIEEND